MFGEIGAWFYKALGGIKPDELHPGFQQVRLAPHFVSGLDRFSAEYLSVRGAIRSDWERTPKGIRYRIEIPAGIQASLMLDAKPQYITIMRDGARWPYRQGMVIGSGKYECIIANH